MTLKNKYNIPIKEIRIQAVNNLNIRAEHMSKEQFTSITNLTKKFSSLFSKPNDRLSFTTCVQAEIRTTSDAPIYTKYYPYPMSLQREVEAQIQKLLDDDIIRPSRSPYISPVIIVPKKLDASGEKKYRLVIDYRKLNSVTIADRYPIPEINEVLAQLGDNEIFSVLDLKSGFHQILLREKDIEKTAFSIKNGKYEFKRRPFGLKSRHPYFKEP